MTKLRHGEGSVKPYTLADGTERWRARWREGGRMRSRSFLTEEAGQAFLIEMSGDRRLGRHKPTSLLTVKEVVEAYLKRNAGKWSTNTIASYGQVARSHVYPHIGNRRVGDLTTLVVQEWIDTLVDRGLAASTVRNAHLILRGSCSYLVRVGELQRNPAHDVDMPARKRTQKRLWSEADAAKVFRYARDISPVMEVYYRVSLTTGMRPGEVRALKWQDVDFERGVITVQRSITRDAKFRQIVGDTTKTGKGRNIAVPASTLKALQAHRTKQIEARLAAPMWVPTDLIFERGDGTRLAQQTLRRRHIKICRAAGVEQIRFHDTRHSAAVIMLKRGVSIKVVSEILGHASIVETADTYLQVDLDMQRVATDMLGMIDDGDATIDVTN